MLFLGFFVGVDEGAPFILLISPIFKILTEVRGCQIFEYNDNDDIKDNMIHDIVEIKI